jgi:hypothetical protein
MVCNVCGANDFVNTKYRADGWVAPALECTGCHAISLSEDAAMTDEEHDSVKLAIAMRAAVAGEQPFQSARDV